MKKVILYLLFCLPILSYAQVKWTNVDSLFQPLPSTVHVYFTNDSLDGKPNIAYYVSAVVKDKNLIFTVDTTLERRLTPTKYFVRNDNPLVVVNSTFFEFTHSKNLNVVIKNGEQVGFSPQATIGRGKDTFTYRHTFSSAIGISKKRKVDVAWLFSDSTYKKPYAFQTPISSFKDSARQINYKYISKKVGTSDKWKMQTAVGGGPVLLQNGEIKITNNEEQKFGGKNGLTDKHPRTCMGYTADGKLIIMAIQGRFPNKAEGATLVQEAQLLKNIGCVEALNLDGGGSSCMLVNGKETIKPSDKEGQRGVPCVFIIK